MHFLFLIPVSYSLMFFCSLFSFFPFIFRIFRHPLLHFAFSSSSLYCFLQLSFPSSHCIFLISFLVNLTFLFQYFFIMFIFLVFNFSAFLFLPTCPMFTPFVVHFLHSSAIFFIFYFICPRPLMVFLSVSSFRVFNLFLYPLRSTIASLTFFFCFILFFPQSYAVPSIAFFGWTFLLYILQFPYGERSVWRKKRWK